MKRDMIAEQYKRQIRRMEDTITLLDDTEFLGRFYKESFIGEMWQTTPEEKRQIAAIIMTAVKRTYKNYLDGKKTEN